MLCKCDKSNMIYDCKKKYFSGFDKDPRKSKFEMHMKVPFDQIVGQYQMTGQFLLIALKGSGAGKMQFSKCKSPSIIIW